MNQMTLAFWASLHQRITVAINLLFISAILISSLNSCSQSVPPAETVISSYVVMGDHNEAIARVITSATECPLLLVDGKSTTMQVRAKPGLMALRGDRDVKATNFPVLTCEAVLPTGTKRVMVGQQSMPVPQGEIKRIAIIADTGCRLKDADKAYQNCNDPQVWPLAQIAQSAADLKPDLVLHIGDLEYRESPCPKDQAGCAGSPWGYGFDSWNADVFQPLKPLLSAAPWVFVRGNHESCNRAGQGWFRFIDPRPWTEARSCNNPDNDADGNYTEPYGVMVAADTQLIVFDSAAAAAKAYQPTDLGYQKYVQELQQVGELAKHVPHNIFMNHHPALAFGQTTSLDKIKPGSTSLQSVFGVVFPNRLYPENVDLVLNGHVHLFEELSFASDHPSTFVLGNAGSATEGELPQQPPKGAEPAPGAVVEHFATRVKYGFATLDRIGDQWQLTERDVTGKPVLICDIHGAKSECHTAEKLN